MVDEDDEVGDVGLRRHVLLGEVLDKLVVLLGLDLTENFDGALVHAKVVEEQDRLPLEQLVLEKREELEAADLVRVAPFAAEELPRLADLPVLLSVLATADLAASSENSSRILLISELSMLRAGALPGVLFMYRSRNRLMALVPVDSSRRLGAMSGAWKPRGLLLLRESLANLVASSSRLSDCAASLVRSQTKMLLSPWIVMKSSMSGQVMVLPGIFWTRL